MKKLFLHIGCGKTGSSAIQLWLNHNADALRAAGVKYPLFGSDKLDDYAITSGNGQELMDSYSKGTLPSLLEKVASETDGDILFSSELFQSLGVPELVLIREMLAKLELEPVVIAYVRDVYDMIYSSYLQLIKRHLLTQPFRDFALSQREMQQFQVVRNWSSVFDDIRVIHYDSEKASLDISFCEALGLEREKLPPMSPRKVNRSLKLEEAELLRLINHFYLTSFKNPKRLLSWRISDAFIMADPEAVTPILMDKDVIRHVEEVFRNDIDWINSTFFGGRPVLAIFNPEGKQIATEIPTLSNPTVIAIRTLMSSIKAFEFD